MYEGKKPVKGTPGWNVKARFVDSNGDIYSKGKFTGETQRSEPDKAEKSIKESEIKAGVNGPEGPKHPNIANIGSPGGETEEKEIPLPTAKETVEADKEITLEELPDNLKEQIGNFITSTVLAKMKEASDRMALDQEQFYKDNQKPTEDSGITTAREIAKAIVEAENFKKDGVRYTRIEDLDPKDVLSEPAVFTSYGQGYLILDDVRDGHPVKTPYGRIMKFKLAGSRIRTFGRGDQSYSCFCSFATKSKLEYDWLLNHTKYGIEFFEMGKVDALDIDATRVQITIEVEKEFSKIEAGSILARAKQAGLTPGLTPATARLKLVALEAARRYKDRMGQIQDRLAEGLREAEDFQAGKK